MVKLRLYGLFLAWDDLECFRLNASHEDNRPAVDALYRKGLEKYQSWLGNLTFTGKSKVGNRRPGKSVAYSHSPLFKTVCFVLLVWCFSHESWCLLHARRKKLIPTGDFMTRQTVLDLMPDSVDVTDFRFMPVCLAAVSSIWLSRDTMTNVLRTLANLDSVDDKFEFW